MQIEDDEYFLMSSQGCNHRMEIHREGKERKGKGRGRVVWRGRKEGRGGEGHKEQFMEVKKSSLQVFFAQRDLQSILAILYHIFCAFTINVLVFLLLLACLFLMINGARCGG